MIGTKRVNFEDAGQEVCVRLVSLFGDPFLITVNEKGREGEKRGGTHQGGSNAATGGRVSTMATRSFDAR